MQKTNQATKTKKKFIYKPLINQALSNPSIILTTMCDIEVTSYEAGQQVAVFTCNQQLFRVPINIMWDDPARWKHFYSCIGEMHWLMSFVGSVG